MLILSETNDPFRVQPHLKKCFEGINELCLNQNKIIEGIKSNGETVMFDKKIDPLNSNGLVEIWIKQIEIEMIKSLKLESLKAILEYNHDEIFKFVTKYSSQIVLTIDCIEWTTEVTNVKMLAPFLS